MLQQRANLGFELFAREDAGVLLHHDAVAVDEDGDRDHAERPEGPWRPHRRNPVKSDVRSSRPAGRLFRRDGRWIRPAQDCSGRYGRAVSFQRIERLDLEGYEEREVERLEPDPRRGELGIHTFNTAGPWTVLDKLLAHRAPSPHKPGGSS